MHSYRSENFIIHYNNDFSGNMIINGLKHSTNEVEVSYDELKRIIKIHMNLHGIIEKHTINVNGISADWKEFADFISNSEIKIEISKLENMEFEDRLTWLFKKICL